MKTYDFGVPVKKEETDIDSIIIYNTQSALPPKKKNLEIKGENGELGKASVADAMENCDAMNVIFTSLQGRSQTPECQVIIGNFVSVCFVFTESIHESNILSERITYSNWVLHHTHNTCTTVMTPRT